MILRNGEQAEIIILADETNTVSSERRKKQILFRRPESDYLPRRNKTTGGGNTGGGNTGGADINAVAPTIIISGYSYNSLNGQEFNQLGVNLQITARGTIQNSERVPTMRELEFSYFPDFTTPPDLIFRRYYDDASGSWVEIGAAEFPDIEFPSPDYKQTYFFKYPTGGLRSGGQTKIWNTSIVRFPVGWFSDPQGGQSSYFQSEAFNFYPETVLYVRARDNYGNGWSQYKDLTVNFATLMYPYDSIP